MFTLFKKRDFGDYVSDSFQFFRITGKHYLKNYFTICGVLLLFLVVLLYFLFQVYFDFAMNFGQINNNGDFIRNYMETNFVIIVVGGVLMFLLIVLLSMLSYSIPVIYMDLYAKNHGASFDSKEILAKFKAQFGRVFIFFLGLIFVVTPLLVVVFALLVLLCFILIGIPLLFFAIPTAFSWIALSFYEYLNNGKGFFPSLSTGFKYLTNQYFPNVGSLMIMYLIVQIAMSVFTIFPYAFGMASIITSTQNNAATSESMSGVKIMFTIIMVVSILMSYVLNNLLLVNQGLVYYSRKESDENISSQHSIDLIGSE